MHCFYLRYGIGDDEFSQAYDGCRQLMWFNASCECQSELPRWKEGDTVGCFIDIDNQSIVFSLNGAQLKPFSQVFQNTRYSSAKKQRQYNNPASCPQLWVFPCSQLHVISAMRIQLWLETF